MGIVIGGERAWRRFRKGDIAVALHWINGEPALVLFPAHLTESRVRQVTPFVLPLHVAHEYVAADGQPRLLRALAGATEAALCLGMTPELSVVHRIIDAIVEAIPDLVAMPPEPVTWRQAERGVPVGELTLQVAGERVHQVEVTDPAATDTWEPSTRSRDPVQGSGWERPVAPGTEARS